MVKKTWKDITVADFQRIFELEKRQPEDKLLNLIAIVNGISLDDVMEMPLSKLERHFSDIDFLQEEPRIPLIKGRYTLNGREYKVNAKEFNTAQYIDFKSLVVGYAEHLARFLTIFIMPADANAYGDGYDVEQVEQDISTMSIVDAKAVASFFLTEYAILMRVFLRSSSRKIKRLRKRAESPEEQKLLKKLGRQMREARVQLRTIGSY